PLLVTPLDPAAPTPLFRQLYNGLRATILTGRLRPGTRLPATRTLAAELGLSRTTAVTAYEQLLAEGYLLGRVGSGTFVSESLPEESLMVPSSPTPRDSPSRDCCREKGLPRHFLPVSVTRSDAIPRPFRPGLPALDAFPFAIWERLWMRRWRHTPPGLLGYGDAAGYRPLREAIAAHVGPARGIGCDPDQVLIVSGAQQGFDLVARVLLSPGDAAWFEEPGYVGARAALLAAGVRLVP